MENKDINIDVMLKDADIKLKEDIITKQNETIRHMKHIIIAIIISFTTIICTGIGGFIYYESQFEYEETKESTVDLDAEGENANVEYNDVDGNQYKDNAVHNEEVTDE